MDHDDANGMLDFSSSPPPPPPQPVGIYGWRKRCLYAFVLMLMIVVIMNLALTVWILRILRFSLDGMGHLKIGSKGIQVKAEAEFLKTVYVSEIKSESDPLYLTSSKSVQLSATDRQRNVKSKLVIDQDHVTASCDKFRVVDSNGSLNLLVAPKKVILGNGDVNVQGDITFNGALFTSSIQNPENTTLEIYSNESKIHITAIGGVSLSSTLGDVSIETDDNIFIQTGALSLTSSELYLQGIPTVDATTASSSSSRSNSSSSQTSPAVYQICLCESGKVFLGSASGSCRASSDICPGNSKP